MLFAADLGAGVVRPAEPHRPAGGGRRPRPQPAGEHCDLRLQGLHRRVS